MPFIPSTAMLVTNKFGSLLGEAIGGLKYIIVTILACSYMFCVLNSEKKIYVNRNVLDLSFLGLVLMCFLHIPGYGGLEASVKGFFNYGVYLVFAFISYLYLKERKFSFDLDFFTKVLSLQFLALYMFGIFEFLNPDIITNIYGVSVRSELKYAKFANENRLVGTFINPIIYGAFLSLGFLSTYHWISKKHDTITGWLYFYLSAACGLFVVVFTYSRLSLICYCLLLSIIVILNIKHKKKLSIAFTTSFFFVFIPFVFSYMLLNEMLLERVLGLSDIGSYTENSRIENWLNGIEIIFDGSLLNWVWGGGLGISLPGSLVTIENSLVTILIEQGIAGLVIFLMFNLSFIFGVYVAKIEKEDKEYLVLFFILFFTMNTGNDFIKVYPLALYYWLIIILGLEMISKKRI